MQVLEGEPVALKGEPVALGGKSDTASEGGGTADTP